MKNGHSLSYLPVIVFVPPIILPPIQIFLILHFKFQFFFSLQKILPTFFKKQDHIFFVYSCVQTHSCFCVYVFVSVYVCTCVYVHLNCTKASTCSWERWGCMNQGLWAEISRTSFQVLLQMQFFYSHLLSHHTFLLAVCPVYCLENVS